MTRVLKYIELKTEQADKGPAWIARVTLSRSGTTVYFNGQALRRARKGGISGNHFDVETGEEYWVSGVKKDGTDRHWAGSGKVAIEMSAVQEYLEIIGAAQLDESRLFVVPDLPETNIERFHGLANEPL
jgi:hypothetical protein